MVSLKIKGGTRKEVKNGFIEVEGSCVLLIEEVKGKRGKVIFGYCLQPGETITSEGDDYVVEF
jgi:hypothetical protein